MGRKPVIRSDVEKQKQKVESRKRHQHELRRAMAVSDYLLLTATDLHRQATEFVDKLEEKYPGKRDVRKTPEFRNWQRNQLFMVNKQSSSLATDQTPDTICEKETVSTNCQKEMVLRIPLIQTGTNAKETPAVPNMPEGNTQEDQLTSIFDEIPDDVMNDMMAEIRADPDLSAIMNDFNEEVLDQGTVPENIYHDLDICLDIEINDPLEDEINNLLYF